MKTKLLFMCIVLYLFATFAPAMGPPYITDTGQDWRLTGSVFENCKFTGSLAINIGGNTYYVDGNKSDNSGNGLTWTTAFQKLSSAMALSHANIALSVQRGWAWRNVIYVKGDEIVEDFTALAQKTDIIGVGSNDGYKKAGITGTWIIPDTTSYIGCRFYNMMFTDTGANPIFDVDTQGGLEFHDCLFDSSALTTIGLQIEETSWLVVDNCEFSRVDASLGFSTAAIHIIDDTNPIYGCKITNNTIMTAGIGIDWDETQSYNCWANDNYIYATGLTIDEEGDNLFVVNNRLITGVNTATVTAGYDFSLITSVGNLQTGSNNDTDYVPFIEQSE